ncbi:sensor histidine kinase [Aquincola sp. J276]|uniref:sensor histidine kinase n=1 Tax=Aquincola sp. J276 TaxID=2898432 RepID=UPI002150F3CE|nr:histidine kinase [Aquincola sp. J276]MCR5865370.1 histidine kinase [Aquincola sp. J276]
MPAALAPLPAGFYSARQLATVVGFNQLFCSAIGIAIWLAGSPGLVANIVVSMLIGNSVWLLVDGGRWLVGRTLQRWTGQGLPWPGYRWMLPVIVLGVLGGYEIGRRLAGLLLGVQLAPMFSRGSTLIVTTVAGIAATLFWHATAMLQKHRAEAEAAQRQAAETQLRLLQSQLEPHMLFNTLANLRVLITLDPPRAQQMLDRLIGFLRSTLGASRVALHPLQAEFDRTADYLALMAVRMGPRLATELDLPPELAALPVPPLLLQPLVENAIQHGLEPQVAGGRIVVHARQEGDALVLTVRDTGRGLPAAPAPAPPGRGFGTQQIRERLATLHGDAARLELAAAGDAEGGTVATLRLPMPAAPLAEDRAGADLAIHRTAATAPAASSATHSAPP